MGPGKSRPVGIFRSKVFQSNLIQAHNSDQFWPLINLSLFLENESVSHWPRDTKVSECKILRRKDQKTTRRGIYPFLNLHFCTEKLLTSPTACMTLYLLLEHSSVTFDLRRNRPAGQLKLIVCSPLFFKVWPQVTTCLHKK